VTPDFVFHNCHFKGKKVSDGETEFVSKRMVLEKILEDDRHGKRFHLVNPLNNTRYIHFYAKEPWEDIYLLEVVNTETRSSLFVLFDTRLYPNFMLVEKNPEDPEESLEVAMVVEYSLFLAAQKYGWEPQLEENHLNEIRYVDRFEDVMNYVKNIKHSSNSINLILNQPQVSQLIMEYNNHQVNNI
jgi:hypothetical protein